MKINWFSPLPPASTEIANYTLRLLPSLAEQAEILLWTTQSTWNVELEKYGEVCTYSLEQIPWSKIHQGDLNIYNIGNNAQFHLDIWQISRHCSGLVVLHDYKLQHFFSSIYQHNHDAYSIQMEHYYGVEGKNMAQLLLQNRVSIDFMAENYPLTPLALENAAGVITHNKFAYEQLTKENQWITAFTPLPYDIPRQGDPQLPKSLQPPYRLIIFGYLGTNRCLNVTLQALASFPRKSQFKLDIYGEISHKNHVIQQIQELEIEDIVTVHGFVSEETLKIALSNAHLAINLRYPTMGEASATQLRIWGYGLPSLVTQVGWYQDLSKDSVAFVRPYYEIEDIHQHLQKFLNNPQSYLKMGQKGREILAKHHSSQQYSKAIIELSDVVQTFKYCSLLDNFTKSVGKAMSLWYGDEQLNLDLTNVSQVIHFYLKSTVKEQMMTIGQKSALADKKVVFLHIPKTAGMTFTAVLKQLFDKKQVFPSVDPVVLLNDFSSNESAYQLFPGHFFYEVLENFSERPVTLTFLRNPIDRLQSHYYFYKIQPDHAVENMRDYDKKIVELSRKYSLEEFVCLDILEIENGFYNLQTRYIANNTGYAVPQSEEEATALIDLALKNLHSIDFIGIVEDFENSLSLFKKMFSIEDEITQQPINVNAHRPRSENANAIFQENPIAKRRVALDQKLYDEGIKIYHKLLAKYKI